jgi:hypothetical protein
MLEPKKGELPQLSPDDVWAQQTTSIVAAAGEIDGMEDVSKTVISFEESGAVPPIPRRVSITVL